MDAFLQVYWWCIVSLLGGVLVFLMFVQGGQSLLWPLGRTRADVDAMLAATGRRWNASSRPALTVSWKAAREKFDR